MKKLLSYSFFLLLIIGLALSACSKEHSNNWQVSFSGITDKADHLVLVNSDDYSSDRLYDEETGSNNLVWGESQSIDKNFFGLDYNKQIEFEIPDSTGITEFSYTDEAIFTQMKCSVYYFTSSSKHNGYYRIHKGFISGTKTNGQWNINFSITFGGEDNDKYQMIKGAQY